MPPLTYRLARVADAHALAVLSRDHVEKGLSWRYVPARLRALIRSPEVCVVVASDGEEVAGFAVMEFGDTRAHLVLMCVQPGLRRRGVGRGLIDWLLASAEVAGIESVHLELRADNEVALAFYRSLGFSETLQLPGYYGGRIAARRMLRLLRPIAVRD